MTECNEQHHRRRRPLLVADSFVVDFCDHGYGLLSLFKAGEDEPFAVAYFAHEATIDLAQHFASHVRVKGNA